MLKVRSEKSVILEGTFDDYDTYPSIVKESRFATLLIKSDIEDFEDKCVEVTAKLAEHGQQYGTDYVIASTVYAS